MRKAIIFLLLFCMFTVNTHAQNTNTVHNALHGVTYFFVNDKNTLYGLGDFEFGLLGNGELHTIYDTPVKIMNNVRSITSDSAEAYAIKTDGSLWRWGYSYDGETQLTPIKIMENVLNVSNYTHTLILKEDGTLWGFGNNECNSILSTDVEVYDEPQYIMSDVKDMKAGINFSVILKNDGSVWTVGKNSNGYLGDGTTEDRAEPKKILDNIKAIHRTDKSCYAIDNEDNMWMWG